MKNYLKLATFSLLVTGLFYLSACQPEEELCKQCSGTQEIISNGQVMARQNISAVQYCGDALKQIEANPVVTVDQTVGATTQQAKTTYTCQ